ncbi:glycosyltransferase family 9 protein [Mucilaginibacter glaciei]|uniref:Glycosyltransferase family 9 protein n=1 Tax=Mucilaginibacter glaciei TaxID=2772109 RepID=A0A926NQM6_9SPHI|nr:glycosyltransferase family 9 protein [Mucilaginibacter glaciei]MBD1392887.1 glycosyltransferase family 9 protein [Mucilaginibacter glaciei]
MPVTPKPQHILISRTDAIGDVVLTLPVAAYLKELLSGCKVSFLGRNYTGPVINTCTAVDEFISYDNIKAMPRQDQLAYIKSKQFDTIIHVFPNKHIAGLAKKAGIPLRVGTTNRLYHWLTCNETVKLSRKNSDLHEAQLNLALLRPFGYKGGASLNDLIQHYKFSDTNHLPERFKEYLPADRFNLIIHPKSHGSGMEWGLNNFAKLIDLLPADKFNVIISGSNKERELLFPWIATLPGHVIDLTGQMSLTEFISFIFNAGGLIASGTGPLHIAAASGIHTLGLFPSLKPIHAGRWAPLGEQAEFLESGTETIDTITVDNVFNTIDTWI